MEKNKSISSLSSRAVQVVALSGFCVLSSEP